MTTSDLMETNAMMMSVFSSGRRCKGSWWDPPLTRAYRSSTTACHCRFTCPHLPANPPPPAPAKHLPHPLTHCLSSPPSSNPPSLSHLDYVMLLKRSLDFLEALKFRKKLYAFLKILLVFFQHIWLHPLSTDLLKPGNHSGSSIRERISVKKSQTSFPPTGNWQPNLWKDSLHSSFPNRSSSVDGRKQSWCWWFCPNSLISSSFSDGITPPFFVSSFTHKLKMFFLQNCDQLPWRSKK